MHPLIETLPIACFAALFARLSNIIQWIKWRLGIEGNVKPFDCELCMGWWFGLIYFFFFHPVSIPLNIGLAAVTSILSVWITCYTNNLSSTSKF